MAWGMGFTNISVSSSIEAKIGFIARGQSTTADAYLTPEVKQYLQGFVKGFKNRLEGSQCKVSFMQSDGALADFKSFSGLRAILCESHRFFFYCNLKADQVLAGPAGGVVGYARTSYDPLEGSPVVGFDMGGTVGFFLFLYCICADMMINSRPTYRVTVAPTNMCLRRPLPVLPYRYLS